MTEELFLGSRAAFWHVRRTNQAGGLDWAVTEWLETDLLNTRGLFRRGQNISNNLMEMQCRPDVILSIV